MIEYGLMESASYKANRQLSPTLKVTKVSDTQSDAEDFLEIHYTDTTTESQQNEIASDKNIPKSATSNTDVTHKTHSSPGLKDKKAKNRMNLECKMEQVAATQSGSASPQRSPKKGGTKDKSKRGSRSSRRSASTSSVHSDEGLTVEEQQLLDSDEHASFEEDKLLLEINEILEPPVGMSSEKVTNDVNGDLPRVHRSCSVDTEENHSPKASNNTVEVGTELAQDALSDDPDETHINRSDSVDSDKSASSNIGSKAMMLKSKLSTALTGWQDKDENKYELQDMRPMSPTELQADNFGFPLAIFTKVNTVCSWINIFKSFIFFLPPSPPRSHTVND